MLRSKYTPLFIIASIATIALFMLLGYAATKNGKSFIDKKANNDSIVVVKQQADSLKKATEASYTNFNEAVQKEEIITGAPSSIESNGVDNVHAIKKEVDEILEIPNTSAEIVTVKERKYLMDETIDALKIPKEKDPIKKKNKKQKLQVVVKAYNDIKLKQADLSIEKIANTGEQTTANENSNIGSSETTEQPTGTNTPKNIQSPTTTSTTGNSNVGAVTPKNKNGIIIVKGGKVKNVKFNILTANNNNTINAAEARKVSGVFDFTADKDINNTNLYVIVTLPDGSVIRNSDWDVSAFKDDEGNRKIASKTFKIDYKKGSNMPFAFDFSANALKPGTYTFEIYHNSLIVHKFTKSLQ